MQKNMRMTETLAHGFSSENTRQELFNEYQHDRTWMVFKHLCILVLGKKVASALKGVKLVIHICLLLGFQKENTHKSTDPLFAQNLSPYAAGG